MKIKLKALLLLFIFSVNISTLYAQIKVGTAYFRPPFIMSPTQGFDIDLISILCKRMTVTCEIIPMDFNELFTSLDKGKIDLAISGIIITPERQQEYIFSTPYMLSQGQFLVLKSSRFKAISDLVGKNVGAIKGSEEGSVFYNYLKKNYNFKLIQYRDTEDLISALGNNDIEAVLLHKASAGYWLQNGGDQFKMLGKSIPIGNGLGVMALPKNIKLIQLINQNLSDIEKDGLYLKLYEIYFQKI